MDDAADIRRPSDVLWVLRARDQEASLRQRGRGTGEQLHQPRLPVCRVRAQVAQIAGEIVAHGRWLVELRSDRAVKRDGTRRSEHLFQLSQCGPTREAEVGRVERHGGRPQITAAAVCAQLRQRDGGVDVVKQNRSARCL